MAPKLPATPEPARLPVHDVADEAVLSGLEYADVDLSNRDARSVEIVGCRFVRADLGGMTLQRAVLRDCGFERTNLANLRAEESSMVRVRLSVVRMTGLHWVGGGLREVAVSQCRADLSSFRFTSFRRVVFADCKLTRADFQNADLTGVRFDRCDLTGAQFSQATMTGTRFSDCNLLDIRGVTAFDGAIVAGHDLVALSHTLAAALGIRIEGPADSGPADG